MEDTPYGRLAWVARAECYKTFDNLLGPYPTRRQYPPDFVDFCAAFERPMRMELLNAKLEEARLKPVNDARIKELVMQLAEMSSR